MKTATHQLTRHVSVPHDEGIRVDKAITIKRPVSDVYAFWRQLDNLPLFMRHINSIIMEDDLHSHWEVKSIGGKILKWDAEIIQQRENEMMSWRSAPGADVDNAGSVWFTPLPGGQGTLVRVELKYVPPAGHAGALLAKVLGRDPDAQIEEDLNRLKTLLETGQLPDEDLNSPPWPRRAAAGVRQAARAADDCVRNNPWRALGSTAACAFALGLLLGCRLLSRRK
jgi:uncharacterized membrane protein